MGRFLDEHHLDAREDQEDREQIQHPAVVFDDRRTQANHDGAQHDHAQDAPEQHPMLVFAGNGEEAEDQRDDEDVVHRQRLFDHKGGQILGRRLGPHLPVDKARKADAQDDVHRRKPQAFPDADFMVVLVQHPQIERQKRDHQGDEQQPHPQRLGQKSQKQQFHLPSSLLLCVDAKGLWKMGHLHRARSMRSDITTCTVARGARSAASQGGSTCRRLQEDDHKIVCKPVRAWAVSGNAAGIMAWNGQG